MFITYIIRHFDARDKRNEVNSFKTGVNNIF